MPGPAPGVSFCGKIPLPSSSGLTRGSIAFNGVWILGASPRMTLSMCKAMSFHAGRRRKRTNRQEFSMLIVPCAKRISVLQPCACKTRRKMLSSNHRNGCTSSHIVSVCGRSYSSSQGLPRGQRFSSSHIAVHFFKKPAAPPPAAGFFVFVSSFCLQEK